MVDGSARIQVANGGVRHPATISWRWRGDDWSVLLESPAFEAVERDAADAFEALCLLRAQLEPLGWRIGVAGAQADIWPSGMARDQGGGLRAYRMSERRVEALVDTFEPVDPATVVDLETQRAATDRLFDAITRLAQQDGAAPSQRAGG